MRADDLTLPPQAAFSTAVRGAVAARVHAARLRASADARLPAGAGLDTWWQPLLQATVWVLVLVAALVLAAIFAPAQWVLPSALLLTAGLSLIHHGVALARKLKLRALWWRSLCLLRRWCCGENLCRLLFVAGMCLALWNLSGLQDTPGSVARSPAAALQN